MPAVVAIAVVVEQLGETRHRLAGPRLPPVAVPIEAVDLGRRQRRLELGVDWQREPDVPAARLRPGDLLGDEAQRVLAALADEQGGRVIVVGQRTEAVEDLVEEILRMEQLHDPPVDAVADLEHPLAVHRLDGIGHDGRGARHQSSVIMIERRRLAPERHRAPRRAAAADRREHHVAADRRPGMADEAGDVREIPVVVAGQRHDDACVRLAGLGDGDAPAVSLEERPAFA